MTFHQEIERQALEARRQMVRVGQLLGEDGFRERLHVSASQLARMVTRGDIFAIEVDGIGYFPSLLVAPEHHLKRLHSICRILVPVPPSCRLGYLSSLHGNLGGISPLEALHGDESYRLLRRMARAYAAGWSRTSVTIFVGSYEEQPSGVEPTLTAVDEVDPRVNVWTRAAGALRHGGYIWPCGPYPRAPVATVFIARHPGGEAPATSEARIDVSVVDNIASAVIVSHETPAYELGSIQVADEDSIVDVVLRVVVTARESESKGAIK